jgi:succinate-semialdehyde dehydrogenase / glutarate-semialdehyde dehydrogenase
MRGANLEQLKDQSLFIEKSYVNGEWVGAQSGETFEVHGKAELPSNILIS